MRVVAQIREQAERCLLDRDPELAQRRYVLLFAQPGEFLTGLGAVGELLRRRRKGTGSHDHGLPYFSGSAGLRGPLARAISGQVSIA